MKTQFLGRFTASININRLRLAFQPDGTPVVAYHDGSMYNGGPLAVQYWTGAAWAAYPLTGLPETGKVRALAVHPDAGQPWLAYQVRLLNQFFIRVARWDGAAWLPVGQDLETNDQLGGGQTAFNIPGPVTLAFHPLTHQPTLLADDTPANGRKLRAWTLTDTTWTTLGAPLSPADTRVGQLAFAAEGTLYVAYCDRYANATDLDFDGVARGYGNGGISDRVTIKRWDGAAWHTFGVGPPNAVFLALAVDPTDQHPWIVYRNTDLGYAQLTVRRWDGAAWPLVGQTLSYTAYDLDDLALRFSATGTAALVVNQRVLTYQRETAQWTESYTFENAWANYTAAAFAPGADELSCALLLGPYGNPQGGTVARRVPPVTAELSNRTSGGGLTLHAGLGEALPPDQGLFGWQYDPELQVWTLSLQGIAATQLRWSLHERDDPTDTPIGAPVYTVLDATPGLEILTLAAADLPTTATGLLALHVRQALAGHEGPYSTVPLHNPAQFSAVSAARDPDDPAIVHLTWTLSPPGIATQISALGQEDDTLNTFGGDSNRGDVWIHRWITDVVRLAAEDNNGAALVYANPITIVAYPPVLAAPTLTLARRNAEGEVILEGQWPDNADEMPPDENGWFSLHYDITDQTGDDHRAATLSLWSSGDLFTLDGFTPPLLDDHAYTVRLAMALYGGGQTPWSAPRPISHITQSLTTLTLSRYGNDISLHWELADPSETPAIELELQINADDWLPLPAATASPYVLDRRAFHTLTDHAYLNQPVTLIARARLDSRQEWLESAPLEDVTGVTAPVLTWGRFGSLDLYLAYRINPGTTAEVWLLVDDSDEVLIDPAYPPGRYNALYGDWRGKVPAAARDGQEHTLQLVVYETQDGETWHRYLGLPTPIVIDPLPLLPTPEIYRVDRLTQALRITTKPITGTERLILSLQLDHGPIATQTLLWGQTSALFPLNVNDDERGYRLARITHQRQDRTGAESAVGIHTERLFFPYPRPAPIPAINVEVIRQGDAMIPDRVRFTWTPTSGVIGELIAVYTPGSRYTETELHSLGYVDSTQHTVILDNTRAQFKPTGQTLSIYYGIRSYDIQRGVSPVILADPVTIRAADPQQPPPLYDDETARRLTDQDVIAALEQSLADVASVTPLTRKMLITQTLDAVKQRIKALIAQGSRVTLDDFGVFAATWKSTVENQTRTYTERRVEFTPSSGFSAGVKAGTVLTDAQAETAP